MRICVLDDVESAARYGATQISEAARSSVRERGSFSLALSGGSTPWPMLSALAGEDIPWASIHVFQVDERAVPMDSPERTFAKLRSVLLSRAPIPEGNIHPMPVDTDDLDAAARRYERTLVNALGFPPVLDLVHLGIGADGHTASLIPGAASLASASPSEVMVSDIYQGSRRMTLTYPILNRARMILWLIIGEDKAPMLPRLIAGDTSIPAGCIEQDRAILIADRSAAALLKEQRP